MYSKGDRVKLLHVNDPYTRLAPGTLGTVSLVDSLGTVHVKWDDGSHLGIVEEAGDRIELVKQEQAPCWFSLEIDATDPEALLMQPSDVFVRLTEEETAGWPVVELLARKENDLAEFVKLHWGDDSVFLSHIKRVGDRQDVAPDDPTNSYIVEEDPDEDGRWNVLPNSGENDPPETYIVRSGDVYFVYLFIRGFGGLQIPVSFRDFTRAVDTALLLAVEKGKEQS